MFGVLGDLVFAPCSVDAHVFRLLMFRQRFRERPPGTDTFLALTCCSAIFRWSTNPERSRYGYRPAMEQVDGSQQHHKICTTVDPVLLELVQSEIRRRGITRARLLREALLFYASDGSEMAAQLASQEARIAELEATVARLSARGA